MYAADFSHAFAFATNHRRLAAASCECQSVDGVCEPPSVGAPGGGCTWKGEARERATDGGERHAVSCGKPVNAGSGWGGWGARSRVRSRTARAAGGWGAWATGDRRDAGCAVCKHVAFWRTGLVVSSTAGNAAVAILDEVQDRVFCVRACGCVLRSGLWVCGCSSSFFMLACVEGLRMCAILSDACLHLGQG